MEHFFYHPDSGDVDWHFCFDGNKCWWEHGPTGWWTEAAPKMMEITAALQRCHGLEEEIVALREQLEELTQMTGAGAVLAPAALPAPPAPLGNDLVQPPGAIPVPSPTTQMPCTHHGQGTCSAQKAMSFAGAEVTEVWKWHAHLSATLFSSNTTKGDAVADRLTAAQAGNFIITSCRTKANRFFHLRCRSCEAACYGEYDESRSEAQITEAQDSLLRFLDITIPEGPPTV